MAYTILLVDDEDEVRGRIASKIEGEDDFKVIGSASNGYDALDLLEENIPDVVITDIKMPFVDGIELTRIIRERYPTIKVAIISGYDDYSYLKDAINLDVVAYLSKPISKKNVREFLDKIKKKLEEEREHIKLKESLALTQIRNRIIYLYLNNYVLTNKDKEKVHELGIDLKKSYVVVSIELIYKIDSIIEIEKKKDQCFLVIEDLIKEVYSSYHVFYDKYIVSIIAVEGKEFNKELDILLYKIVNYLKKYLSVDIAIGVSNYGTFDTLSNLFRQSQLVLNEYEITNNNNINYYSDLNLTPKMKSLDVEDINEFKKNIRYMNKEDFQIYTKKLADKIKKGDGYDYFSIIITLSGLVLEYANSIESDLKLALDINNIKNYVESKNIEKFMTFIVKLIFQIREEVISRNTKKSVHIMNIILDYIEQNYTNPNINMDMICEKFNISISYLSALFKKETNTTFNKYIISKRIDYAKLLLKNSEEKMVSIAEKCGYKDVYYFSHSFKKVTGLSPKEYRKNAIN